MTRADKQQEVGRAFATSRLEEARAFLQQAEVSLEAVGGPYRSTAAASSAMLAGIAASDAACGFALGRISRGEHGQASKLLQEIIDGNKPSVTFARLIQNKTTVQYLATPATEAAARLAIKQAESSIAFADSHHR